MLSKYLRLLFVTTLFINFFQKADSQISIPVSGSLGDVEERSDGSVNSVSTDIELINDGNNQTIGLRFENLQVLQGMEITAAYLQFTTDEQSAGSCNLQIRAQAADNALVFEETYKNVSSRELTLASVSWQPSPWNVVGEAGPLQRTPNLAPALQEVIDRPGWAAGNSVVFVITGSGRRTAGAFDGDPDWAARLVVEVNFPGPDTLLEKIFMNELMAANGKVQDEFGEVEDWVEIYNGGNDVINLAGLYLTDEAANLKKWKIAAPKFIPPGEFALLWLDNEVEEGGLHASFSLNNEGEFLALVQELNGQTYVLDALEFPEIPFNISYGRQEDGQGEWTFFGEISPGASNNGKGRYLDTEVKFSNPGGFYPGVVSVQLSVDDPDAVIYYTLDGRTPTQEDKMYTQALVLSDATIVRARAFKPGYEGSRTTTEHYFINPAHKLPIICVQTEPENLWDSQKGIYITGTNGVNGYCSDLPRNWNQDWERPANISYFEPDGTKAFQVDAGIKIGGGCSRGLKMKSLNVYLRNKVYGVGSVNYQLFPGLDIHEFKRFKLRNGGNDFEQMFFRDGINQTLLYNIIDLDLMAYRPVVVYLNGKYWGLHEMREFFNEDYVASHHGANPDSLDIINNPQESWPEVMEGDYTAFQTIRQFIQDNDLSKPASYEFLFSRMDMSEYMNYHIAEIYLANYDWPANNVRVWRDRNGGKFRWMLYDTDASTNYGWWSQSGPTYNSLWHATTTTGQDWPNGPNSTLFLRKLLKNEEFRNEFVQRTATYRKLIFAPDRVNTMTDSLRQTIEPEMSRHINRWNGNFPSQGFGTPSGGSVAAWQGYINTYKSFFPARSQTILSHYREVLQLEGTYSLTFVFDEKTPGDLYLHSHNIKIPYNFTADYFKNIPLKVKVVARPGYHFVKWLETGETNPDIEFAADKTSTLTPVFVPVAPILTEIYYHPKMGEACEFLEFYNATNEDLQLGGVHFSKGVEFEFPSPTVLPPGDYLLVVKDKSKYASLSCQVFEWLSGDLDNTAETVELVNSQGVVVEKVTYSSSTPWVSGPNGGGPSLSLISPFSDNEIPQNWEASILDGGSPCGEKSPVEVDDNERSFSLKIYPNPVIDNLIFEYATLAEEAISLEVVNTLGQAVRAIELPAAEFLREEEIPVKNWPAGVYFIRLKGEKKAIFKVVKG
jgi:hypothetical protein